MKSAISILLVIFFTGCAVYKELRPMPVLSPAEKGFQELTVKEKKFTMKKGKKYFVSFPAPAENNFYLVMDIKAKNTLLASLTSSLVKQKTPGQKIADQEIGANELSVYPVQANSTGYFWLIDTVPVDMELSLKYRYVPQWRYKYEKHHENFKKVFKANIVDRQNFNTLGKTFIFENDFDYTSLLEKNYGHIDEINKVYAELIAIESIFPASIIKSDDPAYVDYLALKNEVVEEKAFQEKWINTIHFFNSMSKTRGNTGEFIKQANEYTVFCKQSGSYPEHIVSESRKMISDRLTNIIPYYNDLLFGYNEAVPFDKEKNQLIYIPDIESLYTSIELPIPATHTAMLNFVEEFNKRSNELALIRDEPEKVASFEASKSEMPDDAFYPSIINRLMTLRTKIPERMGEEFGNYNLFKSVESLNRIISDMVTNVTNLHARFAQAEALVRQLNSLKVREDYQQMINLLDKNRKLDFLVKKYSTLDDLLINKQKRDINTCLAGSKWKEAEQLLESFNTGNTFLEPAIAIPKKKGAVLVLEEALYLSIDKVSRENILKFVEEKITELENVDSLYADSVFLPAYDVVFSSGNQQHLVDRKNELVAMLLSMKSNEFPSKAITLLYDEFVRNPDDNGVLKARAVVSHGRYYTGDDQKLKLRIAECDQQIPKRIQKPMEYRRVFALPVTDNRTGANLYLCRLDLSVPSDAAFPVWDITIKLPPAVAKNASVQQWYEKITLNKELLKNEGRFSISSPTADNGYECQISPLQTKKDGRNILDIYFNHKSFKAYQISVMVQKPIIKKN